MFKNLNTLLQKPIVLKKPYILNVEEREGLLTAGGGETERQGDRDRSFAGLRERQELRRTERETGASPD
jgi:hypothetical protein